MTYAVTTTHEATLSNFVGTHINGCNKEVVCITTRQRWASITDAAIAEGVCTLAMSRWVHGKATPRNGKRYCLASELNKHLDTMLAEDADYEEMKRKAALWDAHVAEQEAEFKANEALKQAIAEAEKNLTLRKRVSKKMDDAHQKAIAREMEAEAELTKLQNMSTAEWKDYAKSPKMKQKQYNKNAKEKRKAKKNEN